MARKLLYGLYYYNYDSRIRFSGFFGPWLAPEKEMQLLLWLRKKARTLKCRFMLESESDGLIDNAMELLYSDNKDQNFGIYNVKKAEDKFKYGMD